MLELRVLQRWGYTTVRVEAVSVRMLELRVLQRGGYKTVRVEAVSVFQLQRMRVVQ